MESNDLRLAELEAVVEAFKLKSASDEKELILKEKSIEWLQGEIDRLKIKLDMIREVLVFDVGNEKVNT